MPLLPALADWQGALVTLALAAVVAALMRGLFGRRRCAPAAGEHVLITGGSKGLGLELARLYAARGCKVTVVARSQPDLDAALDQLRAAAPAGGAAPPVLQALSADTCDAAKVGADPQHAAAESVR